MLNSKFNRHASAALLLIFGSVFTGCSSLNVVLPSPQVERPDVPGKTWAIEVGGKYQQTRSENFSTDPSLRPPVITGSLIDDHSAISEGMLGTGLGERFEVAADLGLGFGGSGSTSVSGCGGLMAKYQILGNSRREANVGDIPVSVFAHHEACSSSTGGNQNGNLGPAGYNWHSQANAHSEDLGFSAGYRFQEKFMVYGGFAFGTIHAEGTIHNDLSDNGQSPASDYSVTSNPSSNSVGLGLNWGKEQGWVNLLLNYSHIGLGGSNPDNLGLTLSLGFGS